MDAPDSGDANGRRNKRQRTSAIYDRKRAVTACQPCRLRKTKCDNLRPTCGFCQKNQGHCVYPDASSEQSAFDPASLAILDRLNHVVSLLERRPVDQSPGSERPLQHLSPEDVLAEDEEILPSAAFSTDEILGGLNAPGLPAKYLNCESVLAWPCFAGASVGTVRSLALDVDMDHEDAAPVSAGRGIREEDFHRLTTRFLMNAHVKNPVLDIPEFRRLVRDAIETGPRWDGPSCLVLITCAIGCITEPLDAQFTEGGAAQSPKATTDTDMATAQCYYLAAKKRLGLLRSSHINLQCIFLFGIFEMYCLRPHIAWEYFNQASLQCRNLLWREEFRRSRPDQHASRQVQKLEQRLYWSCLKSEMELRSDIPLPPSGFSGFDYPNLFPCPPTGFSSPIPHDADLGGDDMATEEERSWFYYLAEISYRKMMNRAISAMSPGEDVPSSWTRDIGAKMRRARELNEQVDVWMSHLPPPINTTYVSDHELAVIVRIRGIQCREWIHRPFLYYAIHQPHDDPHIREAIPLAQECLRHCVDLVLETPTHRQHGTWFVCRSSVTRILLFLAAARSGRFELPEGWRDAMNKARRNLQHWKSAAPDLEVAAQLVERLVADTAAFVDLGGAAELASSATPASRCA